MLTKIKAVIIIIATMQNIVFGFTTPTVQSVMVAINSIAELYAFYRLRDIKGVV